MRSECIYDTIHEWSSDFILIITTIIHHIHTYMNVLVCMGLLSESIKIVTVFGCLITTTNKQLTFESSVIHYFTANDISMFLNFKH